MLINDTIAAIGTALGQSGIAIVRVSGPRSIEVVEKFFKAANNKSLSQFKENTINYGYFFDNSEE